jgi:hypothetical protein
MLPTFSWSRGQVEEGKHPLRGVWIWLSEAEEGVHAGRLPGKRDRVQLKEDSLHPKGQFSTGDSVQGRE